MERNYVTVILCIHNDCVHLCVQHDAHDSARSAGSSEAADTRLTLIFPRANINISRITMRRRCAACFGCCGARHKRINEKAKCAVRASPAAATLSVLLLPACWMSFNLRSSCRLSLTMPERRIETPRAQTVKVGENFIRYDTRCYFNVRLKANMSQLNLLHGTDN